MDGEPLSTRLRLLRARLGFSQEQLARQLGVSFATVNRWEAGRSRPSARALRAIDALAGPGSPPDGALPVAQSVFVGRHRELGELAGLLNRARLITLTGPGGTGKTRLAVEAASRWAAGRIAFVPLEHVKPPQSAASAIAARLGLRDRPGVPLRESLLAALRELPWLLLIDRAEHHRDEVAALLGSLLPDAPGLRVLVTSRVVLGLTGEVCWAVPPLDCPSVTADAVGIAASDAVRLFVARAADRLPGFSLAGPAPLAVAELCRRLGGLPLAIELIAGWVGTLSIDEIVRHRTVLLDYGARRLTDVLRASYDLLAADQQRVLRTLSVFAEPPSLADAAAVLGMSEPEAAVAIRALVDSSWLTVIRGAEQNRFAVVEVVRLFAAGCLVAAGESASIGRRHARHFADLALSSEDALAGPGAPAWTARLEAVAADLHAVLHWAAETGEVEFGLAVSAGLWRWWLVSGRLAVGRSWLGRFLALAAELAGTEPAPTEPAPTEPA